MQTNAGMIAVPLYENGHCLSPNCWCNPVAEMVCEKEERLPVLYFIHNDQQDREGSE